MKISGKTTIGLIALVLVLALVASVVILPNEYPTRQTASLSFVIEEDFTKVRKIMVRTDAAKEIITMGGGSEFVEQQWTGGNVDPGEKDLGKLLLKNLLSDNPNWKLELDGTLKVRTLDDYVGQNVVTLKQHVEIVPDHLQSDTNLLEGSERLLGYEMMTRLEREGEHTRVTLGLTQEIKTDAPWFAHGIADRRVRASVEQTLANQEVAMRKLIEENLDKNWLFPLR
ncbi:MAG: hypothetical protein GXP26_00090 [Planctomycetes bacterium]|nr:hypothetical protein [Planctomycetota bacterium]